MKLRTKTLLIISITLTALIALLLVSSSRIILDRFAKLEESELRRDAQRVIRALDADLSRLQMTVADYARWDDAWQFMADRNPRFLKTNFPDSTFMTLRLNIALLVDPDRRVVYQQGFDLGADRKVPAAAAVVQQIVSSERLLELPAPASSQRGVLLLPGGPMLVASCPVVTGATGGPIRGALVMGRYLDATEIGRIADVTAISVAAFPLRDPSLPPDVEAARTSLTRGDVVVGPASASHVAAYVHVTDLSGGPGLALRITEPRTLYHAGEATLDYLMLVLVVSGGGFILLSLLVLERTVLGRVTRLVSDVSQVGSRRDLSQRVRETRKDELGLLAGAINTMLDALQRSQQENARLLKEATDAAEAKDRFIATVSHELRNPLTSILAGMDIVERALPADKETREAAEMVSRNVKLQARMVNDLLDVSRAAQGKLELHLATLTLDTVAETAVRALQADAERSGLTLRLDAAPRLWVRGDPDRLQQMALNLIANAIKFTPAPGTIQVTVQRAPERAPAPDAPPSDPQADVVSAADAAVQSAIRDPQSAVPKQSAVLTVEDTGIGIDAGLQPRLFQMFEQGDILPSHNHGMGIGLALVRSIVEGHGGRVWAESAGMGQGSRFTVELPLISRPAQARPNPPDDTPARRLALLLVEDNDDTRRLVALSMKRYAYDVRPAKSAEEALEMLRAELPDVILSDIGLTGIDGYEFLRRAREIPGVADIPAFATTGFGLEEDVRRAREVGYSDHILKPIDMAALDRRVRELLRRPSTPEAHPGCPLPPAPGGESG